MFPIVEKLGGWVKVKQALKKQGYKLTDDSIYQAKHRQKLGFELSFRLCLIAAARGVKFDELSFAYHAPV